MGGDPALTVVPNLLATGILAMIVSLAVIVWAVWFLRGRKAGLVLLLLLSILTGIAYDIQRGERDVAPAG